MLQSGMQDMLLQLLEKPVMGLKKSCTAIIDLLVAEKNLLMLCKHWPQTVKSRHHTAGMSR